MSQPMAIAEFTARVLELYATDRYSRKTYLRMSQVLRELAGLGVRKTSDLTTATMAGFVKSKGAGANPNTVNGLLSAISAACSYAVEEGWLDRPPNWRRVRLRGAPCVVNRPRSYEEVTRLLGHLHGHRERSWEARRLCALTWTVALTGTRLGEAIHGQVEDLCLEGPSPRYHVNPLRHRLKTSQSERYVPIPEVLTAVLADWIPRVDARWIFPGVRGRGPWIGGTSGKTRSIDSLKRAGLEVGISTITWHSLRHAFGTSALERWQVPLWIVQRVLGHTDVRTTQRYLHTQGSPAIQRAMAGIGYR